MKKILIYIMLLLIGFFIISFWYVHTKNIEKDKELKKQLIFENNIQCMTVLNFTPSMIEFRIKYSEQFNSCIYLKYNIIKDAFSKEKLFEYDSNKEAQIKFVNIK